MSVCLSWFWARTPNTHTHTHTHTHQRQQRLWELLSEAWRGPALHLKGQQLKLLEPPCAHSHHHSITLNFIDSCSAHLNNQLNQGNVNLQVHTQNAASCCLCVSAAPCCLYDGTTAQAAFNMSQLMISFPQNGCSLQINVLHWIFAMNTFVFLKHVTNLH